MEVRDKIHIFTDADLDGSISYLTFCWYKDKKLDVTVTTEKSLKNDFEAFCKKEDVGSYKTVAILDIDISRNPEIYDKPNVVIFDHHLGSLNCPYKFKHAKVYLEDEGSTCRLLYKKIKTFSSFELDNNKKLLISIGHDYDSYTLKNKDLSVGLNTLFWNMQGNRLEKFVDKYYDGFSPFTEDEKKIILFYRNKIKKHLEVTPIYKSTIKLGSKDVVVCSMMTDFCINEFAQEIINNTRSDIGIIVNPKTESVSFRKSKDCTVDLSKLAKKLCNGGGHENAAGGLITPEFLQFTKLLNQIERVI